MILWRERARSADHFSGDPKQSNPEIQKKLILSENHVFSRKIKAQNEVGDRTSTTETLVLFINLSY